MSTEIEMMTPFDLDLEVTRQLYNPPSIAIMLDMIVQKEHAGYWLTEAGLDELYDVCSSDWNRFIYHPEWQETIYFEHPKDGNYMPELVWHMIKLTQSYQDQSGMRHDPTGMPPTIDTLRSLIYVLHNALNIEYFPRGHPNRVAQYDSDYMEDTQSEQSESEEY